MLNKIVTTFLFSIQMFCYLSADESYQPTQCFSTNNYSAGYIQAKVDSYFPGSQFELAVCNEEIIVYQFPTDPDLCAQVTAYLESIPGFQAVRFDQNYVPNFSQIEVTSPAAVASLEGNWLPELSTFFPTLLANPRIIGYSAGYRSYDRVFKTAVLPVSMGDKFTIYQFQNLERGRLFLGIEAGVWAVFEAKTQSLALLNADYYIGLPITYINNGFSLRFRIYHESSHLGDELMVEKQSIHRVNPSTEVVDLFVAYDITPDFTIFGGVGRAIRSDESYKTKPWHFISGFNYYLNYFKTTVCNLEATPYIGVYFNNSQDYDYQLDSTVTVGYQWDKLYGRKLRLYAEGHSGFSHEGQFSKKRTQYIAIKLLYGY